MLNQCSETNINGLANVGFRHYISPYFSGARGTLAKAFITRKSEEWVFVLLLLQRLLFQTSNQQNHGWWMGTTTPVLLSKVNNLYSNEKVPCRHFDYFSTAISFLRFLPCLHFLIQYCNIGGFEQLKYGLLLPGWEILVSFLLNLHSEMV